VAKIKLNNVRLSFPNLFRKAVFSGEETKYEATFLLDKVKHADLIKEIHAAIAACTKEKWQGKIKSLPADKLCLKDGDNVEYAGYAGSMSFKAANKTRPMCVDRDRSPITEDDNKFYAGCYVNGIVELWAQDNSYGKRINANLLGVQFLKDGEPFADGGKASADDFDAFEDEVDDFV
jgi:hypothetical protein